MTEKVWPTPQAAVDYAVKNALAGQEIVVRFQNVTGDVTVTAIGTQVAQRIGDAARDKAIAHLGQALGQGFLTITEHDQRMEQALDAQVQADLDVLTTDLDNVRMPAMIPPRKIPAVPVDLMVVLLAFTVVCTLLIASFVQ